MISVLILDGGKQFYNLQYMYRQQQQHHHLQTEMEDFVSTFQIL